MNARKVPQRVLDTMRPEFVKKIRELMTEAFALAGVIEEPKLLEDLWDELSKDFAGDAESAERILTSQGERIYGEKTEDVADENFDDLETDPLAGEVVDRVLPNTNLVTGRPLSPTKKRQPAVHPRQYSGPMSPSGRPTSQYKGVSWTGGGKPWRVRHLNHTVGYYFSEEEAARAYDAYLWREKKSTGYMNFPEDYRQ